MKIPREQYCIGGAASIRAAMRCIDRSGLRVVYVTDRAGKLAGVVSDSEIRKAILGGRNITDRVGDIVKPDPVVLTEADAADAAAARRRVARLRELMPDSRHLLLVGDDGRPRGLVPCSRYAAGEPAAARAVTGRRVLVVGGAGYLGSVLVRHLLAHSYRVRVLDRLLFGAAPLAELRGRRGFELVRGDIRDLSTVSRALRDVDAVINLAALVGDPACKHLPAMAIETNYLANRMLAEACKYQQINRYLFASTCSVYGQMAGDAPLTEDAPLRPVSLYARSKIQAETGILELVDDNFSPAILRMGTLFGWSPRMRFDLVVNTMTKTALSEGRIIVHGGGGQWRPLLHVADAAEAYRLCLEAPLARVRGAVFNVGSEALNCRIRDIAAAVHACLPQARLEVAGAAADVRNYAVSFTRIRRRLKFRARHGIADGVRPIARAIRSGALQRLNAAKYYNEKLEETNDAEE